MGHLVNVVEEGLGVRKGRKQLTINDPPQQEKYCYFSSPIISFELKKINTYYFF